MIGALSKAKNIVPAVSKWWKGTDTATKAKQVGDVVQMPITGSSVKTLKASPWAVGVPAVGLGALFAGEVLGGVGGAIKGAVTGESQWRRFQAERMIQQLEEQERLRAIEEEQRAQSMMINASRLAATSPQLYSEVMAGRRLPAGAVVFGGRPRVDLLEQLAGDMADGVFPREKSPEEQLQQLLGA